jgi:drug/metabolite transporter (DMT)-like permease
MTREDGLNYLYITLILGLVTLFGDVCYFTALRYLDVSRIYPLINTQSLFTIPLAFYFFSETIPSLMWLSSILMICGVLFVGGKNDSQDKGMNNVEKQKQKRNFLIGILGGIGTGFSFGTQYVMMNMLIRISGTALECNVARTDMYAIMLWIYILISRKHFPRRRTESEKLAFRDYVYTGLVGILSFGIGDSVYQLGVNLNGASTSIIIGSSAPVFNQILSIGILKEKFRKNFLIGVICIVIGNILVIF